MLQRFNYAKIEDLNIRYENIHRRIASNNEYLILLDVYKMNRILFGVNKFNHFINNGLQDLNILVPLERIHKAKRRENVIKDSVSKIIKAGIRVVLIILAKKFATFPIKILNNFCPCKLKIKQVVLKPLSNRKR